MVAGLCIDSNTFDLIVDDASLVITPTEEQNAQLILLTNKGEWKQYAPLGVGLEKYLHALDNDSALKREILLQLSLDNIIPKLLSVQNGKIQLQL